MQIKTGFKLCIQLTELNLREVLKRNRTYKCFYLKSILKNGYILDDSDYDRLKPTLQLLRTNN